jgi:hypothetical protein
LDEQKLVELLQKAMNRPNPQREALKEKIDLFNKSEAAKLTVKELLTTTANVALPDMVQARAILEMGIWTDLREISQVYPWPKGAGKTMEVQILTGYDYNKWTTEGDAITAYDPTVAKRTLTLASYGKGTVISDLLANTSAINFVENIGRLHGEAIRKAIYDTVLDEMTGANGNTNSCASGSTLTFVEVNAGIKNNADDGYQSDYITCSPGDMWNAFTTSYAVTQFTGALADLLASGVKPKALGLDWLADPYFTTARSAATKIAVIGTKGLSSLYGAMQTEPIVELYREPLKLANTLVSHIDLAASEGIVNSINVITSQT